MTMLKEIAVRQVLNDLHLVSRNQDWPETPTYVQVCRKVSAEKEGQILHEFLIAGIAFPVHLFQGCVDGDNFRDSRQGVCKHLDQFFVVTVIWSDRQSGYFSETFEGNIASLGWLEKFAPYQIDDVRFEYVAKGYPVEEPKEGFERCFQQRCRICRSHDFITELEDGRELVVETLFQIARLLRCHLVCRVIKNLLGQQPENDHVVLAYRQTRPACRDYLVDEVWPVIRPLLFQDGDEHQIELIKKRLLLFVAEVFFGLRVLNDKVDDKVSNT